MPPPSMELDEDGDSVSEQRTGSEELSGAGKTAQ
ncbi:unnamed protein product [Brugia pahangi]|uniref:CTNNB1_binding domain-containing protein n=1 Tax=Brugia pahangi TaxID=6280 RepID=A0A0N4T992_BRUPA|nr:unnamed protein product [Brugia pahangi]